MAMQIHVSEDSPIPSLERSPSSQDLINRWRVCCCPHSTDARFLRFVVQHVIIFLTMLFCFFMLINAKDCESQNSYSNLLMFLLGFVVKRN